MRDVCNRCVGGNNGRGRSVDIVWEGGGGLKSNGAR